MRILTRVIYFVIEKESHGQIELRFSLKVAVIAFKYPAAFVLLSITFNAEVHFSIMMIDCIHDVQYAERLCFLVYTT